VTQTNSSRIYFSLIMLLTSLTAYGSDPTSSDPNVKQICGGGTEIYMDVRDVVGHSIDEYVKAPACGQDDLESWTLAWYEWPDVMILEAVCDRTDHSTCNHAKARSSHTWYDESFREMVYSNHPICDSWYRIYYEDPQGNITQMGHIDPVAATWWTESGPIRAAVGGRIHIRKRYNFCLGNEPIR